MAVPILILGAEGQALLAAKIRAATGRHWHDYSPAIAVIERQAQREFALGQFAETNMYSYALPPETTQSRGAECVQVRAALFEVRWIPEKDSFIAR